MSRWTLIVTAFLLLASTSGVRACNTNCLRPFLLRQLGPKVLVKVVDENFSHTVAVITGEWTKPDGTKVVADKSNAGTRQRAEFSVVADMPGTYTFDVINISKDGYTFDYTCCLGLDLPATYTVAETAPTPTAPAPTPTAPTPTPPAMCEVDCVQVKSIDMSEKKGNVKAVIKVVDETGANVRGAVVEGDWTLPDSSETSDQGTTKSNGRVVLREPIGDPGVYTFTIATVTKAGLTYDASNGVVSGSYEA